MFVKQIVLAAVLMLWDLRCDAATKAAVVKLCGRDLGDVVSRVCDMHNSPSWVVPTVNSYDWNQRRPCVFCSSEDTVELIFAASVRRKRRTGIADECCLFGCNLEQLSAYCSISAKSDSPMDSLESHMIADRSAEEQAAVVSPVVVVHEMLSTGVQSEATEGTRREVGGRRRSAGGYGRARGLRCGCRRRRRSGRRRTSLMGNPEIKNVARAAPVLGTVSPLLTWGRTLNTDLPSSDAQRYAYYTPDI